MSDLLTTPEPRAAGGVRQEKRELVANPSAADRIFRGTGPTEAMFESPQDPRTSDYVHGRFG
jgi:hypothetical protein